MLVSQLVRHGNGNHSALGSNASISNRLWRKWCNFSCPYHKLWSFIYFFPKKKKKATQTEYQLNTDKKLIRSIWRIPFCGCIYLFSFFPLTPNQDPLFDPDPERQTTTFNVILKILKEIKKKKHRTCLHSWKTIPPRRERPNVKMLIRHVFMEESNSKSLPLKCTNNRITQHDSDYYQTSFA